MNLDSTISPIDRTSAQPGTVLWTAVIGTFLLTVGFAAYAFSSCLPVETRISAVPPARKAFAYERYDMVIGNSLRPTVLTGSLLGRSMSDLAVVDVLADGSRSLTIHGFDGNNWSPGVHARLSSQVTFVDVVAIDGVDRLVTYRPGLLSWFDPESGSEREWVRVDCNFAPPRAGEIPHVDISHDLNHDGRVDLVLPATGGFRVLTQLTGGGLASPVQVGVHPDLRRIVGADGYRYDPWAESRVHEIDYDQDGRSDLAFWNGREFEVHLQGEGGEFSRDSTTFPTQVEFRSDRLEELIEGGNQGRMLHSLADLNNDRVADLVVFELDDSRSSKKQSSFQVHYGSAEPGGGTRFDPNIGMRFQGRGSVYFELECWDVDGDGEKDILLTGIENRFLEGSLWKRIKGAMGDDVWLDLEIYRSYQNRLVAQPDARFKIALDGVPSHREPGWVPLEIVLRGGKHERRAGQKGYQRAFNSTVLFADATGDGRSDLFVCQHPRMVNFMVGAPGLGLVAPGQELDVAAPNDEEYTWSADVDRDGRQDLIMHHPFTKKDGHGARQLPPGSEPHRVTVLISR